MNLAVRSNVRIYAARGEGGMNSGRSLALMSAGQLDADSLITHHFPAPAALDAKCKDSSDIKFAGGNLFREVSTWILP